MTQILSREEGRALLAQQGHGNKGKKPAPVPVSRTKEAAVPTDTPAPPNVAQSEEKEKRPKQAVLPPPPEQQGPWKIGPWELRNTTTYAPAARLTLTGPDADFENLLAHLQAYQP